MTSESPLAATQPKSVSLTELLSSVQRCVEKYYNRYFYVTGEISGYRGANQRGHCYFELVDKISDPLRPDVKVEGLAAKASAVIWRGRYEKIAATFRQATGIPLGDGIRILAQVEVNFTPLYGLQLVVNNIDPNYTIGEAARQRKETIERLTQLGIIDSNKLLALPRPIRRVAVVSSPTAAGYQDFVRHIEESVAGSFIHPVLYRALMQGDRASGSVAEALERIRRHIDLYDLVVVIRGGGGTSDLSAFDQFAVARAVAEFPIPVWSGIGHQRDQSVVDMVAHSDFKTPTAVATALVDAWCEELTLVTTLQEAFVQAYKSLRREKQEELQWLSVHLREEIVRQLHREQQQIGVLREQLTLLPRNAVRGYQAALQQQKQRLVDLVAHLPQRYSTALQQVQERFVYAFSSYMYRRMYALQQQEKQLRDQYRTVERHRTELTHLNQIVQALHPRQVLQRGYAIVRHEGHAVTKPDQLHEGDIVWIELAEGSIEATLRELSKDR